MIAFCHLFLSQIDNLIVIIFKVIFIVLLAYICVKFLQ